jgi:predicted DNA-binding transcriptional regulator AlpA
MRHENDLNKSLRETLLDEQTVTQMLDLAKNTLAKWRCQGRGPRCIKLGGRVRYRMSDIDAYLHERTVDPSASGR